MSRFIRAVAVVAVMSLGLAVNVSAASSESPSPSINYLFDGSLTDSAGGSTATPSPPCPGVDDDAPCIATSGFGADENGPYWEWTSTSVDENGGGLRIVTDQPMGTTYTFILEFAFDEVDGYRRIMDFKNRDTDWGLYIDDSYLDFYRLQEATEPVLLADQTYYLVGVRESTGGTSGVFTAYVMTPSGALQEVISVNDPDGESIYEDEGTGSIIGLFFDDGNGEAVTGGRVYLFRAWPGEVLTPEEIESSINTPVTTTTTMVDPEIAPHYAG